MLLAAFRVVSVLFHWFLLHCPLASPRPRYHFRHPPYRTDAGGSVRVFYRLLLRPARRRSICCCFDRFTCSCHLHSLFIVFQEELGLETLHWSALLLIFLPPEAWPASHAFQLPDFRLQIPYQNSLLRMAHHLVSIFSAAASSCSLSRATGFPETYESVPDYSLQHMPHIAHARRSCAYFPSAPPETALPRYAASAFFQTARRWRKRRLKSFLRATPPPRRAFLLLRD